MFSFIIGILSFITSSCGSVSITKRKYTKGWYINNKSITKSVDHSNKSIREEIESNQSDKPIFNMDSITSSSNVTNEPIYDCLKVQPLANKIPETSSEIISSDLYQDMINSELGGDSPKYNDLESSRQNDNSQNLKQSKNKNEGLILSILGIILMLAGGLLTVLIAVLGGEILALIGVVVILAGLILLLLGIRKKLKAKGKIQESNSDARINKLALIGFILFLFLWAGILGIIAAILGLILCAIAFFQIRKRPNDFKAKWLATLPFYILILGLIVLIPIALTADSSW